jgi:hypothetical protein
MRAHLKVAPHPSQRAHSSTVPLRRGCSSAYLSGNATSQGCESEPLGDLSQYRLFTFRKQQSTLDLTSQDPVLCRQIFVPQQEFLTDRSGDLGHHPRLYHPLKARLYRKAASYAISIRLSSLTIRYLCDPGPCGAGRPLGRACQWLRPSRNVVETSTVDRHKNKTGISALGRDEGPGGWGASEPTVQAPTNLHREVMISPGPTNNPNSFASCAAMPQITMTMLVTKIDNGVMARAIGRGTVEVC